MPDRLTIDTSVLLAECVLVPWDRAVFGFPVAQIERIEVREYRDARVAFAPVSAWLDQTGANIASCRLAHHLVRESMFLEGVGFRFVEMVISPQLERLDQSVFDSDTIEVEEACRSDLPALQAIAEQAFGHERYHIDPRLDRRLADLRYGQWVANTLNHDRQKLFKCCDGNRLVGMFIVEQLAGGHVYWHLTAIAPQWQGRGYGYRVWRAMLQRHQTEGCKTLTSNVSVRNVAVLNLYARLGFRFMPPKMTFHWIRGSE